MFRKTAANLFMLVGSIIWGIAFVIQGNAMAHIGPFTMGATRFFLGAVMLVPLVFLTKKKDSSQKKKESVPRYIRSGAIIGVVLFAGATLQQVGLIHTTAGKSGFISALYMVMVPFASFLFFRRHVSRRAIFAAGMATLGIFLLCLMGEGEPLNVGDLYTFLGSIFWTMQILAIEKYAEGLDGVKLAIVEFLVCSGLNAVPMFLFERPSLEALQAAMGAILYCGLLSVGIGFTAQILCIQYTDPFSATLIMSTESVFGALAGWLFANETMNGSQLIGCVLVFVAVLLAQLPSKEKKDSKQAV